MKHPKPRNWYPINKDKYLGDPNNIIARSSYEIKAFNYCDRSPFILKWGSEEIIIPYISPMDNMPHRYYPDLFFVVKDKTGNIKKVIAEIKPKKFTSPPKTPKRKTKRYLEEVMQWGVNEAKWKAAEEYCKKRGISFLILTEDELEIKR